MQFDDDRPAERDPRSERKGARRRQAEAMRKLADRLAALPADQLAQLPLPPELANAVQLARRISAHGGRRRQLQLVAKLLRQSDAEPIESALEHLSGESAEAIAEHHLTERWRERLLADPDAAITDFLSDYPRADRQRLRQLVRAAGDEQAAERPPRAARELFRLLRDTLSES